VSELGIADWVTLLGLPLTLLSLALAASTLRQGNRNASAALLLTLQENFRAAWARYKAHAPGSEEQDFEFHDIINLFEAAAAALEDRAMVGSAKKIMETYICDVLKMFAVNPEVRRRVMRMRHDPTTFEHLVMFLVRMRRENRAPPVEALDLMIGPIVVEAVAGTDETTSTGDVVPASPDTAATPA